MSETLLAVFLGVVQGVLEWLPVSSEGAVAIVTSAVGGFTPDDATRFALFLHAGTGVSALAYYRDEVRSLLGDLPDWRPRTAFDAGTADLSFLAVAVVATGVTGIPAYLLLEEAVSALEGGAFVALVGVLLVLTGLLQRFAGAVDLGGRERPDWVDAVGVGVLQGFTILPGVSRSGVTVSALLLRGHDAEDSLRLSFLLSIPAAAGAAALVVVDDGVPALAPADALLALGLAAVVGYLTVGALVRLVRRVPFWGVCVGFGGLAVLGGGLLLL